MTAPADTAASTRRFRRFSIEVIEGPSSGTRWDDDDERCTIGSHPSNGLVINDPTVSRFHCELIVVDGRFRLRDLGSRNGTTVSDVAVLDGLVKPGAILTIGHSRVRVAADEREGAVLVSDAHAFGGLVGSSPAMRETYARLERAAAANATVLIEGETGTGKEGAAAALHAQGARASGPFVALDCGAIPATLFEAELFGAEAGAYTGATHRRIGAFEEARGGTLFLDEIGELAPDLQAKLLRALETRTIRRIGSRTNIECDVRVIAATNRDLRERVNAGTFRADLYYRLAVLRITLPPLRERLSDLHELVAQLLDRLDASAEARARLTSTEHLATMAAHPWPGNVRELRNYLEQSLVFGVDSSSIAPAELVTYDGARRRALATFERDYVHRLMREAQGNVADAAKRAGVNRAYLYRLIRRHRED